MNIIIDDIKVEIQRKHIKNMHLHVNPDGRVYVTVPMRTQLAAIETFVSSHAQWVRDNLKKYEKAAESAQRRYEGGETIFILGKEYELMLVPGNGCEFYLKGSKAVLIMPPNSDAEQRTLYMREVYRQILLRHISVLFPKWEKITGLKAHEVRTKYMKTRWGTCNPAAKRIWLNVQLAQHPARCIEYVILHELVHFWEHNHGDGFKARMDRYMPDWREIRKELNDPSMRQIL